MAAYGGIGIAQLPNAAHQFLSVWGLGVSFNRHLFHCT